MTTKLSTLRFNDYYNDIIQIDNLTKFNIINNQNQLNIIKITLNFSFNSINFNKKKVIAFLMALELLTGQKVKITKAKKPTMALKIRQGSMVGCVVTLQKKKLYSFYEYLLLALARSENFKSFSLNQFKKQKTHSFSITLKDLFNFYQLEADLEPFINNLDITFLYNTKNWQEKAFLTSSYKLPIKN